MTQQFVLEYLTTQKELFFANYKVAIKSLDGDAVHDLRVSVKRLKTLLRMLNYNEKANYVLKQSSFPIRFIYREFGKLRDRHVLEVLLIEYQQLINIDFHPLFLLFELQKKNEIDYFRKIASYFKILSAKRSFQTITSHVKTKPLNFLYSKALLFKESREQRFQKFKDPQSKKHDLHKARKQVKDIGYLMEMAGNEITDFPLKLTDYKEIGSLLGNWHDRQVLYRYLLSQKSIIKMDKSDYEMILEAVYIDKEKLRNDFYAMNNSNQVAN